MSECNKKNQLGQSYFLYYEESLVSSNLNSKVPCGPSMMDLETSENLPETCRKPARNLPKNLCGRFPAGFRRFPNPSMTDHTVCTFNL